MELLRRTYDSILSAKGDLEGLVFQWDKVEHDVYGMDEVIKKTTKVKIHDRALLLLSHNDNAVLGRHKVNLHFRMADEGLMFRAKKSNTTMFKDVCTQIEEGILTGCSMGFHGDPVIERDGTLRTFDDIEIVELSLCANPAYSSANVGIREHQKNKVVYPPECYL